MCLAVSRPTRRTAPCRHLHRGLLGSRLPLGYALTETKAEEAIHLVELGCAEVDMVVNIAALLEGEGRPRPRRHRGGRECGRRQERRLRDRQGDPRDRVSRGGRYRPGSRLASRRGAFREDVDGFGPRGASVRDCEIMRAAVGPTIGVKAAGGIRDLDTALRCSTPEPTHRHVGGRRDSRRSAGPGPLGSPAMPAYPLRVLVLRKTKLGETDIISRCLPTTAARSARSRRDFAGPAPSSAGASSPTLSPTSAAHRQVTGGRERSALCGATRGSCVRTSTAPPPRRSSPTCSTRSRSKDSPSRGCSRCRHDPRRDGERAGRGASRLVVAFLVKALAMHGYRPSWSRAPRAPVTSPRAPHSRSRQAERCVRTAAPRSVRVAIPRPGARLALSTDGATMLEAAELEMPPRRSPMRSRSCGRSPSTTCAARLKALDFYAGTMADAALGA